MIALLLFASTAALQADPSITEYAVKNVSIPQMSMICSRDPKSATEPTFLTSIRIDGDGNSIGLGKTNGAWPRAAITLTNRVRLVTVHRREDGRDVHIEAAGNFDGRSYAIEYIFQDRDHVERAQSIRVLENGVEHAGKCTPLPPETKQ